MSAAAKTLRLSAADCLLLVIDVQDKLLAAMPAADSLIKNTAFLLDAAKLAEVPAFATEQYPQGLGPTTPALRQKLDREPIAKTAFSCCGADVFLKTMRGLQRSTLVLAGMETHVCVLQTALDLLDTGHTVHLPVDALASRHAIDHDTALRRLENAGAVLTTVETVGFEWLAASTHPQFKAFSRLIRGR